MKLVPCYMPLFLAMLVITGCKARIPVVDGKITATPDTTTVTVSWIHAPNAVSYLVYRGTGAGQELMMPVASGLTGTAWVDREVIKGVVYYYKVAGVNRDGVVGAPSLHEGSAKLLKDPPVFDSFIDTTSGNGTVGLSWNTDSDAVSYNVYRFVANDKTAKRVATGITGTSWKDKYATNGVVYYYRMASVDSDGEVSPLSPSIAKASPVFAAGKYVEGHKDRIAFDFSPAGKIKVCYTTYSCV